MRMVKEKKLTDMQILEKYVDLEKSCLSDTEEKETNGYIVYIYRCI